MLRQLSAINSFEYCSFTILLLYIATETAIIHEKIKTGPYVWQIPAAYPKRLLRTPSKPGGMLENTTTEQFSRLRTECIQTPTLTPRYHCVGDIAPSNDTARRSWSEAKIFLRHLGDPTQLRCAFLRSKTPRSGALEICCAWTRKITFNASLLPWFILCA